MEVPGGPIGRVANALVGKEGEANMVIGKADGNFTINSKEVDVSIESKPVWAEAENNHLKAGVGLSLDTGLKSKDGNVEASFLGFGVSGGTDGVGIKLPFLNFGFKF